MKGKGISLIVLIITIVIILILSTAIIMAVINNNPISSAKEAVLRNDLQIMKEAYGLRTGELLLKYEGDKSKIKVEDYADVVQEKYKGEVEVFEEGLAYLGENKKKQEVAEQMGYIIGNPNDAVLRAWAYNSEDDFHKDEYKTKITKAKFITSNKVPNNVIESWDVSEGNNGGVMAWIVDDGNNGYELTIGGNTKVIANKDSSWLFYNFKALRDIDIRVLDTSKVTNMREIFFGCSNLSSLDLSNFNTENVTDMRSMFSGCNSLTSLDFGSKFDTSSVTNMGYMFCGCGSLTGLDVSKFDTSSVITMRGIFYECFNLTNIDVSHFNTSEVIDMGSMFYKCHNLTYLDLSNFDLSKVTSMDHMFYRNFNLTTSITIRNVNITSYNMMFFGAASLKNGAEIIVNYTEETEELVDEMIKTKVQGEANVKKGEKVSV